MLHAAAERLLDAFAPQRCAGCDAPARGAFCPECRQVVLTGPVPRPRPLRHGVAAAAFLFAGPVREAIHRGKYGSDRAALRELTALALPRFPRAWIGAGGAGAAGGAPSTAVVPVPLAPRRERRRGFNQAALVAEQLAAAARVPVLSGLVRLRETAVQANRDEAERRRNVAGAFAWSGEDLTGRRLLLADDVLTTGATAGAAAEALHQAGAVRVDVAVLATVP